MLISSRSNNNLSEVLRECIESKHYMAFFWMRWTRDEQYENSTESKLLQFPLKRTASTLVHWEAHATGSQNLLLSIIFFVGFFFLILLKDKLSLSPS